MKHAGQVVLFHFPQTDLEQGKLRPALLLGKIPGPYDDWLMWMISTQLWHRVEGFDEVVHDTDPDYASSGLRATSLIRVGRLAVTRADRIVGTTGQIAMSRLKAIKSRLAGWLTSS